MPGVRDHPRTNATRDSWKGIHNMARPQSSGEQWLKFIRNVTLPSLLCLIGCGPPIVRQTSPPPVMSVPPNVDASTLPEIPRIPATSVIQSPRSDDNAFYHEVKRGETLSAIARQYNTSAEQLQRANALSHPTLLKPGQLISIPESR